MKKIELTKEEIEDELLVALVNEYIYSSLFPGLTTFL